MNIFEKKLQEKKAYLHKKPEDTSVNLKKNKMHNMQKIKKNRQFGMFQSVLNIEKSEVILIETKSKTYLSEKTQNDNYYA